MLKQLVSRRDLLIGAAALAGGLSVSCTATRTPLRKVSVLHFAGQAEGKRMKDNIPAFTEHTGIDVIFDELPYDSIRPRQLQSLQKRIADYDVLYVDDIWMYEYARKGFLHDLTSLVERDRYDFDDFFPKVIEAEGILNKQIWLIPQRADVQVLFYNKSIFDNADIRRKFKAVTNMDLSVPKTWEDYAIVARTLNGLQLSGERIIGCAETLKRAHYAFDFFAPRYWSISGEDFFDSQSKPIFNEAPGVAALKYLCSLRDAWMPGSLNATHDETISAFVSGNVTMLPQWYCFYNLLKQPDNGLGDKLGVAVMPGIRLQNGSLRQVPSIGGGSLGIAANSANFEDAWSFVKFMTSREIMSQGAMAGEIVTRRSAYNDPRVRLANPYLDIYLQSLSLCKFRPRSIHFSAVETAIGESISLALAGNVSPSQALDDAASAVVEINKHA